MRQTSLRKRPGFSFCVLLWFLCINYLKISLKADDVICHIKFSCNILFSVAWKIFNLITYNLIAKSKYKILPRVFSRVKLLLPDAMNE